MTETFYEVLGVAEDATTDEIESAYRERLKETHPDVSDDEDAGQETQTLVEARDVLVDEDERAEYDRIGHAAYVGDGVGEGAAAAAADVVNTDDPDSGDSSAGGPEATRDRSRRERAARERVRRERRRGTAKSASEAADGTADGSTARTGDTGRTGRERAAERERSARRSASARRDRTASQARASGSAAGRATGERRYNVRQEVTSSESFGPILPSGQRLTLLGIFFALYPVMVFSAFLPAFPLFVNLIVIFAAVILIAYLQSMPRIALLVFGGWSAIGLTGLVVTGAGLFSLVGFAIIFGTVLPFGFSVLTASALRF